MNYVWVGQRIYSAEEIRTLLVINKYLCFMTCKASLKCFSVRCFDSLGGILYLVNFVDSLDGANSNQGSESNP